MVDQGEKDSRGIGRHGAETALHGTGLPAHIIGVHHKVGRTRGAGADLLCVRAQHHDYGGAPRGKQPAQGIEKGLRAIGQQCLRKAHTPRFAGSQDQTRDAGAARTHLVSIARGDSSANTDNERARQLEAALRRTAIISATTEMAISSGEMAPISRPMGACIRSKAARGMPSFSSSRMTLSTLRLLPIMAI